VTEHRPREGPIEHRHRGVRYFFLPQGLFPNGPHIGRHIWDLDRLVVIHCNWVIGRKDKISCIKGFGQWWVKSSGPGTGIYPKCT
jgi:hypothetical protein